MGRVRSARSGGDLTRNNQLTAEAERSGDGLVQPLWRLLEGHGRTLLGVEIARFEDVGARRLSGERVVVRQGRLQGVDLDVAIEGSGGNEAWIARAPLGLESPIVAIQVFIPSSVRSRRRIRKNCIDQNISTTFYSMPFGITY